MTVTTLPTRATVAEAWAAYQKRALELRDHPERAADLGFCAETARAYRHWQNLFLEKGEAA